MYEVTEDRTIALSDLISSVIKIGFYFLCWSRCRKVLKGGVLGVPQPDRPSEQPGRQWSHGLGEKAPMLTPYWTTSGEWAGCARGNEPTSRE